MWKSCHACIYGNKSILCLAQSFVGSDFQHFQVVVTSWSTFWRCPGTGVVNNPKPLPTTITSGVELTDPSIFFLFFVSKQSSRNRKNLEAHHSCVISESRLLGTLKSSRRKKKEKMATDWKKRQMKQMAVLFFGRVPQWTRHFLHPSSCYEGHVKMSPLDYHHPPATPTFSLPRQTQKTLNLFFFFATMAVAGRNSKQWTLYCFGTYVVPVKQNGDSVRRFVDKSIIGVAIETNCGRWGQRTTSPGCAYYAVFSPSSPVHVICVSKHFSQQKKNCTRQKCGHDATWPWRPFSLLADQPPICAPNKVCL